jgi:hypothetical protein
MDNPAVAKRALRALSLLAVLAAAAAAEKVLREADVAMRRPAMRKAVEEIMVTS